MTLVIDSQGEHITTLASGERMFTQHTRLSIDGVTASGARYIGHGINNTTQAFATTLTQVVRVQNVVQGSADNDVVVVRIKWTLNSNGQPVDLVVTFDDCRG